MLIQLVNQLIFETHK